MGTPFLGQIDMFAFSFAPRGWALCNGQLLSVQQNAALFALFGTKYGGDGKRLFGLPDLRGRVAIGGDETAVGTKGGEATHTLIQAEMPAHNHRLMVDPLHGAAHTPAADTALGKAVATSTGATFTMKTYVSGDANPTVQMHSGSIGTAGNSQPHDNMMPYLTINFCVCVVGIFPSKS
jgi:microcystin-dependent protein